MLFFNKIFFTLICGLLLNTCLYAKNAYQITAIQEQQPINQKESIEFAVQRGSLGNESIENSIVFALALADKAFPGWREYEEAESASECRSVSYLDGLEKSITIRLFSARGIDCGKTATWDLSINYDFENPFNGWTVCISVAKGAYSGKISFAFKPLMPIGQFALVSYVQEFTPTNLIIVHPEEDEEASYNEAEESQLI